MTEQHPITPPRELVLQWLEEIWHEGTPVQVAASDLHIATQAARWGADQQKIRSGPESPLVERVADAIATEATSAGIVNDRPARAAILQVAMWLREQDTPASNWAMRLEQEATPSPRRPKPPSLKEQALETLRSMQIEPCWINGINTNAELMSKYDILRRALEALDD